MSAGPREGAVTWNTRPDLGGVVGTVTVAGVVARWLEIDVTKPLRAERVAGHGIITLALRALDHTSAPAIFNSREAASAQPQLGDRALNAGGSPAQRRNTEGLSYCRSTGLSI
jgi:hypothetical protein